MYVHFFQPTVKSEPLTEFYENLLSDSFCVTLEIPVKYLEN